MLTRHRSGAALRRRGRCGQRPDPSRTLCVVSATGLPGRGWRRWTDERLVVRLTPLNDDVDFLDGTYVASTNLVWTPLRSVAEVRSNVELRVIVPHGPAEAQVCGDGFGHFVTLRTMQHADSSVRARLQRRDDRRSATFILTAPRFPRLSPSPHFVGAGSAILSASRASPRTGPAPQQPDIPPAGSASRPPAGACYSPRPGTAPEPAGAAARRERRSCAVQSDIKKMSRQPRSCTRSAPQGCTVAVARSTPTSAGPAWAGPGAVLRTLVARQAATAARREPCLALRPPLRSSCVAGR